MAKSNKTEAKEMIHTEGMQIKYLGKPHKIIKLLPDTATLKCLVCGGRTFTIPIDKLPGYKA